VQSNGTEAESILNISENNNSTTFNHLESSASTDWGIELKKICFPVFWSYQKIDYQLFSLFKTNFVNETMTIVKGITLTNENFLTYSVNGSNFTPKDFPTRVSSVSELEDIIKRFDDAKICQGVFIKANIKTKCKILENKTCYKEVQSSNWKSYQCESVLFNYFKSKSTVQSCSFCNRIKLYANKLMWIEKNQDCGKVAKCRRVIKNSKRILSRK
jgi:hypothetical protein